MGSRALQGQQQHLRCGKANDAWFPLLPQRRLFFAFHVITELGKENINFPCQQARRSDRRTSPAARQSVLDCTPPQRAALPPLPGAGEERHARLLPCAALHRPLILSPLMLILEVVHRSSLICYPEGVSFRASERETGDSIRVSHVVREHHQLQKAAGRAQQMPMETVSHRPGFYAWLLPVPAASLPHTAVPSTPAPHGHCAIAQGHSQMPSLTRTPAHARLLAHRHTCVPVPSLVC